jgi:predicted outer membrane protein
MPAIEAEGVPRWGGLFGIPWHIDCSFVGGGAPPMRGPLFEVVAIMAGGVFHAAVVLAQAASPTPTPSPLLSATPAPTRTAPALNLPSARAEVDRQRGMDARFMTRVEQRALQELELSRIVAGRSANAEVRAFGQQMVEDGDKVTQALRRLAESQGIDLPSETDAAGKADIERVSRLSTPELDRAYVLRMLRDQDADVADFDAQARVAQEVELQAWVCDTLPLLEERQDRIHAIAGGLGIAAGGSR